MISDQHTLVYTSLTVHNLPLDNINYYIILHIYYLEIQEFRVLVLGLAF